MGLYAGNVGFVVWNLLKENYTELMHILQLTIQMVHKDEKGSWVSTIFVSQINPTQKDLTCVVPGFNANKH